MENNQRLFERFPAHFSGKIRKSSVDFGTYVTLKNISADGICLLAQQPIPPEAKITITIFMPEGEPLILRGHVMWVKQKDAENWMAGIQIDKIQWMKIQYLYKMRDKLPPHFGQN